MGATALYFSSSLVASSSFILGGLEGVLLGGDLLVGVLGAQLHQELPAFTSP